MKTNKSVVIGCDIPDLLSRLSNLLDAHELFTYTFIVANRTSNLLQICNAVEHDLVILAFRNNQLILNDIEIFVRNKSVPLFCIGDTHELDCLTWQAGSIVFTYNKACLNYENHLQSRLSSVFYLNTPLKQGKGIVDMQQLPHGNDENRNLSRYVMELDQKVDLIQKVQERIKQLYPKSDDSVRNELMSISNSIKTATHDQKLWEDFKLYYEESDPNFLSTLAQRHPELTTRDLKYCCYLKMNMGNEDIKDILGINQESVRTHKYRLKKKMDLPKEIDLTHYLRSIPTSRALSY